MNFHLFRYSFRKTRETSCHPVSGGETLDGRVLNGSLSSALMSAFATPSHCLNLHATVTRHGEEQPELYGNNVAKASDGVFLIEIRNNKTKTVMPKDKYEEEKVGHYPLCHVIIDTRPDSEAILVQQNAAFSKHTEQVAGIIAGYISRTLSLSDLGWEVTTELRVCKGTIWDIVRTRLCDTGNRVTTLSLKFSQRKPDGKCGVDRALQFVISQLSASDGELTLAGHDTTRKLLDEKNKDLRATIDLLLNNDYRMKVGFLRGGSLEYGKDYPAVYGIDDGIIKDFGRQMEFNDKGIPGFGLTFWLDQIMPDDTAHEYVGKQRKGRRRRNG